VLVAAALLLSFGLASPAQAQAKAAAKTDHGIVGTWQGTLNVPNHKLRTVLKIKKSPAGKLSAMFYSIDQSGRGISTSSISFKNGVLDYAIEMIDLKYSGKMSADGSSITGTSTQAGHSFPLVFERATPETAWTIPPPPPHIAPMPPTAKPGIEVATIELTKPGTPGRYLTMKGTDIITANFTLDGLIKFAYNVQTKQIIGAPSWASSDKYSIDIKANVPGMPDVEQSNELVKELLAQRFHLIMHTEHKTMSAYVLEVAKGGPKLKKNTSHDPLPGLFFGPPIITLRVRNAAMSDFINVMQSVVLDRPVVDHTGLTGHWDFSLNWTPDPTQFNGRKMPPPSKSEAAPPPLSTAIRQQLGLKLGLEKTSVPVLVIDHVDHPSPN
jgi:uncharacterized protein (TIGR03435 family)